MTVSSPKWSWEAFVCHYSKTTVPKPITGMMPCVDHISKMHGVDCEIKEGPLDQVDAIEANRLLFWATALRVQLDDSRAIINPLKKSAGHESELYHNPYLYPAGRSESGNSRRAQP